MYTALVLFSATHVQDGCLWQQRNGDKMTSAMLPPIKDFFMLPAELSQ